MIYDGWITLNHSLYNEVNAAKVKFHSRYLCLLNNFCMKELHCNWDNTTTIIIKIPHLLSIFPTGKKTYCPSHNVSFSVTLSLSFSSSIFSIYMPLSLLHCIANVYLSNSLYTSIFFLSLCISFHSILYLSSCVPWEVTQAGWLLMNVPKFKNLFILFQLSHFLSNLRALFYLQGNKKDSDSADAIDKSRWKWK